MDSSFTSNNPLFSILASPSYSPFFLNYLPQPIPKDLPPGLDSSVYTFADAFEDLLLVSQGQSLPKIDKRHEKTTFLRRLFPAGEPEEVYVRRLKSELQAQQPSPDWNAFHRQLDSRAGEVWRRPSAPKETQDDKQSRRPPPNTFDELFDSLSSAFAEGQKSWDALLDIVTGRRSPTEDAPRSTIAEADKTWEALVKIMAGDNTHDASAQSHDEETPGYHKKTTVQPILDENGFQIGEATTTVISSSSKHSDASDQVHVKRSVLQEVRTSKKSGWFWN
ncbi:hypothetical protein CP532_1354 [Ophiocordyceps camponoti-leonardi (nom. inval.)]|nr:hypothetical protein CP532_1354 [Ophiocordyceps camponoti-leonardi (nom. inval.)]